MKLYIAIAIVALLATPGGAATIRVPQDYATIKAALTASVNGDEIVVSPGIYAERLEIHKSVILRSTFDGKDWSLVENTAIKGIDQRPVIDINAPGGTPTLRGFRITRDPLTPPLPFVIRRQGIGGDTETAATIEYNIIENQVNVSPSGNSAGAAILDSVGWTIQNNIIRNNKADYGSAIMSCTNAIIKNNIIYGNEAGSSGIIIQQCTGTTFANNTICNNHNSGLYKCTGLIVNNILWNTTEPLTLGFNSIPSHCLIKGYTGPGEGNLSSADPKFVDPANNDFRLKADSPAIDAGLTTGGLKADFNGVQRGLKAVPQLRGDGSAVDIGAFEFIPKPVAIWFQGGEPDPINEGQTVEVGWEADLPTAGSGIQMNLIRNGQSIAYFGTFYDPAGKAYVNIALAHPVATASNYTLVATSLRDPSLHGQTPNFMIHGTKMNAASGWLQYM